MVAADQRDAVGVADLEGQEEEEGLDGVVAPIDEVAEEEVVLVGTLAPDLEQLDEVVELPVNVAADLMKITTTTTRRGIGNKGESWRGGLDRPRSVVIRHENNIAT